MTLLDVSKCFDSIYTHTISWAVKGIEHSKENTGDSSFGNDFDRLMQSMNYNETNGICIGPEASRIFAEVIFNRADAIALQLLTKNKKQVGIDFEVFRYVDDYILFTRKAEDATIVTAAIEESLRQFNLYINHTKTSSYIRPIVTEKTSVINVTKFHLDRLFETALEKTVEGYVLPKKIYRPGAFSRNFITTIKEGCFREEVRYDAVSNYVLSSITKRIERLCGDFIEAGQRATDAKDNYPNILDELTEILFFFYTTNPTVASSFDMSRAIILIDRFLKNNISDHALSYSELVHRNIRQLVRLQHLESINRRQDMIPVEFLNVVLSASELATNAHAEEDELVRAMFSNSRHDYHLFVTCLYYIKNRSVYRDLKSTVVSNIEEALGDCSKVSKSSHAAHLVLDTLSCPYVDRKIRKRILLRLRSALGLTAFTSAESEILLDEFVSNPWFVQWQGIDLLRMIRKKELSAVY